MGIPEYYTRRDRYVPSILKKKCVQYYETMKEGPTEIKVVKKGCQFWQLYLQNIFEHWAF